MLIFKIFEIRGLVKDAREASKDPIKFGSKLVLEKTRLALILSMVVILVLLAVLYILGYTNWILNSWMLFKILFWVAFVPSLFTVPLIATFIKSTTRALKSFPKEIEIKEVEIAELKEIKEIK
jgi:hypothetical protein